MLLQTTSSKITDNEKQCDFEFCQDLSDGGFRDSGPELHGFFSLLSRSLELCWKCFLFLCTFSGLQNFSCSSGEIHFAGFRDLLCRSENTKNPDKEGLDLGSGRLRLAYFPVSIVATWWFIIMGQACSTLLLPL